MKRIKLCFMCLASVLLLAACGGKSDLKADLEKVRLSGELPEISVEECRYLDEADEAVYEQQIAACELYYEAYDITRTSDYIEMYDGKIKPERVAYYCNERRKELNLDISTQLHDNVYDIIKNAEDCDNTDAYLDRVEFDAKAFFDYYADYMNSDDREEIICRILKTFHERSNILAFMFMSENEEEFIDAAMTRIAENSTMNDDYSMYISENNELIKALNSVYGGVDGERAAIIAEANTKLIRKMLEHDSDLDKESIDTLMEQLGEPTPEPTLEPTLEPTQEPVSGQEIIQIPIPEEFINLPPMETEMPIETPVPTPEQSEATYIFGN